MVGVSRVSSLLHFARSRVNSPAKSSELALPPSCSVSTPDYRSLLSNTNGQDPCQVVWALLPGSCIDSISITPGELPPLDQLFNNACLCSTVFYSLFYVCELCTDTQSLELSWPAYSGLLQCENPTVNIYTRPIPADTVIPLWAFQPLESDGKVNIQQAAGIPVASDLSQSPSLPPPPSPTSTGLTTLPKSSEALASTTPLSAHDDRSSPPLAPEPTSRPTNDDQSHILSSNMIPTSHMTPPMSIASAMTSVPPNTQPASPATSVPPDTRSASATSGPKRTASLSKQAFTGASAGLSAAAFVAVVAAVVLFRRDRRLTNAVKQAHLARSGDINEQFGHYYVPSLGQCMPGEVAVTDAIAAEAIYAVDVVRGL